MNSTNYNNSDSSCVQICLPYSSTNNNGFNLSNDETDDDEMVQDEDQHPIAVDAVDLGKVKKPNKAPATKRDAKLKVKSNKRSRRKTSSGEAVVPSSPPQARGKERETKESEEDAAECK